MFKKNILILGTLICPMVFAEPIYLDCTGSDDLSFSVKLDEQSGDVTHSAKSGSAFNAKGFFQANSIAYQKISVVSGIKVVVLHEINRTDLSLSKTVTMGPLDPKFLEQIPEQVKAYTGQCSVVKVSNRKI